MNMMILTNEVVLTLTSLVGTIFYLTGALYGAGPGVALGPVYCKVNQVAITWGILTRVMGGSGIALMRLLYIKHQKFMAFGGSGGFIFGRFLVTLFERAIEQAEGTSDQKEKRPCPFTSTHL